MGREFNNLEEHLLFSLNEVSVLKDTSKDFDKSYEMAINIFQDIVKKAESPIKVLNAIRMIMDGELLSPIRDDESEFTEIAEGIYQSKRWPSMNYLLDSSGKKFIIDSKMVKTVDIHNQEISVFEPFAMSYFYRECLKLSFPYEPPEYPWVIYIEQCSSQKKDYYDTLGICYARVPGSQKLIEIKKFFKRGTENGVWEEIFPSEYAFRCKKGGLLDA